MTSKPKDSLKFYRAEVPNICGYSAIGYGMTIRQALLACKKAYTDLTRGYRENWDAEMFGDFGTFDKAWNHFESGIVEMIAGGNAIRGNENYFDEKIVEKWMKTI